MYIKMAKNFFHVTIYTKLKIKSLKKLSKKLSKLNKFTFL
jgi:hypothetical protein